MMFTFLLLFRAGPEEMRHVNDWRAALNSRKNVYIIFLLGSFNLCYVYAQWSEGVAIKYTVRS